eukprot:scaffold17240_cov49-Attheya_sp.AAC.1
MYSQSKEAAPCLCRPKQPVGLVFWTEAGRAPTARVSPIGGCRSSPPASGGLFNGRFEVIQARIRCLSFHVEIRSGNCEF